MKFSKRSFTFDRSEIFIMFLLFLFSGMLVFSIGIMLGKRLLENECKMILEDSQNKLQECLATKPAEENTLTDNKEKILNKDVTPQEVKPIKKPKTESEITKAEDIIKTPVADETVITPEQEKEHLAIREITNDIRNKFTVQISAHRNEKEAQDITYELYKLGFKSAYYMQSELPNKGTWYRVGIGFFQTHASASKFAEMLKKNDKITSYIIRKIE